MDPTHENQMTYAKFKAKKQYINIEQVVIMKNEVGSYLKEMREIQNKNLMEAIGIGK